MKKKMKIEVELPQPIKLNQDDAITLYLPDSYGAALTVRGDGTIQYQGNGGGAPQFTLNATAIAADIRANVH